MALTEEFPVQPSNNWMNNPLPKYDGVNRYAHGRKRSPQKIKSDIEKWYEANPEEKERLKRINKY